MPERGLALFIVTVVVVPGCDGSTLQADSSIEEQQAAIVNGHACSSAIRRFVVGIGLDSAALPLGLQSYCSGTLIAPNLVLTARHCVAPLLGSSWQSWECNADGTANSAHRFGNASAAHRFIFEDLSSPPVAAVRSVRVPAAASLCNNDVALLLLDRHLTGKSTAAVRVLGPGLSSTAARVSKTKDPWVTVAGFGLLDAEVENHRGCQQREVGVLADSGHPVPHLGKHEFTTSYGTCSGDSGGPVLDRTRQLVGVTSRGMADCRGPGLYPDLAFHRKLIADALASAREE